MVVQVTITGTGGLWLPDATRPLLVERGQAIIFRTGLDRIQYGTLAPGVRWSFVYVDLGGSAALAMADALISRHGHLLPMAADHPLLAAMMRLHRDRAKGDAWLTTAQSARFAVDLLLALVEGATTATTDEDAAVYAQALDAVMFDPNPVRAAAQRLGISREHLARTCHRQLGVPPATWIRRRRLESAARLLAEGNMPVAEIATSCGYSTASHFVQAFRRQHGVSPARYRAALGGG